jgi:hypothetical protein
MGFPRLYQSACIDLVVHPPTGQRILRTTQQDFVPETNTSINLLINVISKKHLMRIKPTTDALSLQLVVQSSIKGFVSVAVADETRVELRRLCNE